MTKLQLERLGGVWSATPTPFTKDLKVDTVAVRKMVEHHLRLGVRGLFLAGTCGEGPWMPDAERRRLVRAVRRFSRDRLMIAVQVTDNSASRVVANVRAAKADGAHIAVVAPPLFFLNANPQTLTNHYRQILRESELPVGIYDRGRHSSVVIPESVLATIYADRRVIMVKDSSSDNQRREIALAARRKRPRLRLLNGNEFQCVDYLRAGYDGLLLGGGIFTGYLVAQMIQAVAAHNYARAERIQVRTTRMLYAVYGGDRLACWLSGLKRLLVELGVFRHWSNYLGYPLDRSCIRNIKRIVAENRDVLLPS